ncbi:hypothetical protein B5D82_16720 [Cognaticolwellia beringensis]|uniref:Uncharacterized protein n=1 Tax=Cognaticolwellia beringensis TaxID=1967665 RepID=A0A222GBJ3_9GAMM|nr:hypothetical protein B5D82_16720 [Cognaticolwellia beringensis]
MLNIFKHIPIITLLISSNLKFNIAAKKSHWQQSVNHNFICTDTFELIEPFSLLIDSRFNFFHRKNKANILIAEFNFCASLGLIK